MLRIVQIEEIADLMLSLPALVKEQEQNSAEFAAHVGQWLKSLEDVLVASRLHQAGSVAALRSALVAVQQGSIPVGMGFRGSPTRSRILRTAASDALQRAADVASGVMQENWSRVNEGEKLAHQIVSVALSRGLITRHRNGTTNTEYLGNVWRTLHGMDDLRPAAVHLESLLGPHDALITIDRVLSQHMDAIQRTWVTERPSLRPADAAKTPQ
jgi:hypothetical protein